MTLTTMLRHLLLLLLWAAGVMAAVVAADTTPPAWVSTFPAVASHTGTSVTISVQANEVCVVYVVVLPAGSDAPRTAEVKARTGFNGEAAVASAVQVRSSCKACHATRPHSDECARLLQDVPSAFATYTIVLSGLSTLTDYDVHVVAQDNSVPANAQASPVMLTFATSNEVDATAPVWQGVPVVEASDHSTLSITAMLDEPGTVFYAVRAVRAAGQLQRARPQHVTSQVLSDGAPPPSVAQVVQGTVHPAFLAAPQSHILAPTPGVEASASVSGLAASTDYDVYVVAQDANDPPNTQDSVLKIDQATSGTCSQ